MSYPIDKAKDFPGADDKHIEQFYSLDKDVQKSIMENVPPHRRALAISVMDSKRRGISLREKWINGIDNFNKFSEDRSHFFGLLMKGDIKSAEDMYDIWRGWVRGDYKDMELTHPAKFKSLSKGIEMFEVCGFHKKNFNAIAQEFIRRKEQKQVQKDNKILHQIKG